MNGIAHKSGEVSKTCNAVAYTERFVVAAVDRILLKLFPVTVADNGRHPGSLLELKQLDHRGDDLGHQEEAVHERTSDADAQQDELKM